MFELSFAVIVFLIAHIVPSYSRIREISVRSMGEKTFMSLYGIVSLGLFIWILLAYLDAPYVELWDLGMSAKHFTLAGMYVVCLLLVATFTHPNPFSLGRGAKNFDRERPMIVGLVKHPAFVAFLGWALLHMLANGDQASLIFFGCMAALSLYGPYSLDQKRKRKMGQDQWSQLQSATRLRGPIFTVKDIVLAIILYGVLLMLHEPIIGVAPLAIFD